MPFSWLFLSLLASLFISSIYPASSSWSSSFSSVSYTEHCSSVVPESRTTARSTQITLPHLYTAYFAGGDGLLGREVNKTHAYFRQSFRLRLAPEYYETIAAGTYKVEGFVIIRFPYKYGDGTRGNYSYGGYYHHRNRTRRSIRFSLSGFWSESSRKLCMVGSSSYDDAWGKTVNLDGVLKLNFGSENNPNLYTGVISGSMESTNSANDLAHFDPILIFSFPVLPINSYSFLSNEAFSSEFQDSRSQSLSMEPNKFCSVLQWRSMFLEMEYAEECREKHQHCSPVGSSLPSILYLNPLECSENERKLRYLATFQNLTYADQTFNPDSSVIGEALWDDKRNNLVGVACRLMNPLTHFGDAVGDCTVKLNLRYPSILTIRNDANIVGQIWSLKAVKDSGYFRKIGLASFDENGVVPSPGARYEYTEMGRVRKSCERKAVKKKGDKYPDGHSYNMRFDISVHNNKGEYVAWGSATPVFIGNASYRGNSILLEVDSMAPKSAIVMESISEPVNIVDTSPVNFSYKISINPFQSFNWSMNLLHQVQIIAEGAYNGDTGDLCMVGCRRIVQNSTTSMDCEILVNFQFPPFNARGELIRGTIKSTRAKTDPLHFDELITQSFAYYREEVEQSLWRMDFEITLVLISNTLACIFIGLQILHLKRNPEVPSFVSLVMLAILSLGHMLPLVLNFEAVFLENHNKQTLVLSNGGKIEANEVTVRVITMVAFLLQVRLLQLVWTAKTSNNNEKKAGFFSLALYVIGGLLTLVLNWSRNRYVHLSSYRKYSIWGDLRSYAGLILDGFLLPQILLNIFNGSAEKALCRYFYIGTSAVRLVPHAYNQYRMHSYPKYDLNATYYYANPAADFYSTAWDIIIPCGVVLFAVIIFVQQRHGGRCVLPQRFSGMLEMYEKVPTVDNE